MNLRDAIRMTDDEVAAFLQGRHSMSMATMGPDGRIHLVAMWYGFVDGTLAVETKAKSQKARNLFRDDRVTCLVEDGYAYEELRGVELVGRAEIVEDPDLLWRIGASVFERYMAPVTADTEHLVQGMLRNRIGALIHVERTASWDHRKLGVRP